MSEQQPAPERHLVLNPKTHAFVQVGCEWLVIILWTLIVTRPYLNLDLAAYPAGGEFASSIQTHHLWTRALDCGLCALWNGDVRGGSPALVDPHGSMLHPLVVLTTLGWGVLNGAKLALAAAFLMAGLAQWWLAKQLQVGVAARLFTACMAVAAGNLAGRMELGAFGVVLSTAACAVVFAAVVGYSQRPTPRSVVLLGVAMGLAIVAGQGYMQVGLLFILPACLLLVPWGTPKALPVLRGLVLASALAILLAGPFLVPFLHFWPQFVKDVDPAFGSAQPLAFVPLNLVINDHGFYAGPALSKLPYPHLNVNYVGWVPVALALLGLTSRPAGGRRVVLFLGLSVFLAFWVASAEPLRWVVHNVHIQWLASQVAGIRHPPQIAGLAVPPLLGLAALGLDRLLTAPWPRLRLVMSKGVQSSSLPAIDLRWLLLIPMALALLAAKSFGEQYISVIPFGGGVSAIVKALETPDLQWVNTPFGEHFFVETALDRGLKLSSGIRTWNWKDRPAPEPMMEANRVGPPPGMRASSGIVDGVPIYVASQGREYAVVVHSGGERTACAGTGIGGDLRISCDLAHPGTLVVKENSWSGWRAEIDGASADLKSGQWLAVDLPGGAHVVRFRYRPWDVWAGVALSLSGLVLACYLWFTHEENAAQSAAIPET